MLSLLVHGLLLSLEFGIPGLGLPSLSAPWNERRAQTPDLSIILVPPKAAPAPLPPPPSPAPPLSLESPSIAMSGKGFKLVPPRIAAPVPTPAKAKTAPPRKPKRQPAQIKSQPKLITQTESRKDTFAVAPSDPDIPAESATSKIETPNPPVEIAEAPVPEKAPVKPEEPAPSVDAPVQPEQQHAKEEAERQALETAARQREEENAKRLAHERDTQRQAEKVQEATKQREAALALQREQEAEAAAKRKQEAATQYALELEEKRLAELKKQEEEKAAREAAELVARKQTEEEARRRAAELERQRQAEELARQKREEELAHQKQAEELAAKAREQELARQRAEAAAVEQRRVAEETGRAAAAAAAARQGSNEGRQGSASPLPRSLYGGDLASRALEQARRPDLLRVEPQRPGSGEPERSQRRSVFGSIDRDVGLSMYIKSWSLKIERNGSLNYSQLSKDKARSDPIVTVAIRSDGSVEDVIINRSSGRADLDEAVRRIVRLNARYAAFPPDLARRYDVIEIRRIWNFDDMLTLIEEVR
jgi:TonB family protein